MIKRAIEIFRTEGPRVLLKKARRYIVYRTVNSFASTLEGGVNGAKYWDLRLRRSWRAVGGHEQTQAFAIGMLSNVDLSSVTPESVLDFGCATGDSAPVLAIGFPSATIALHDISPSGVKAGVARYGARYPVKAWEGEQVDLVYSSNVLEHFIDPKEFFALTCQASNKWVIVQCPWQEVHGDGEKITPTRPNGEHFWTIDQEFLDLNLPKDWKVIHMATAVVPIAWPFGEQLFLLLEKA